MSVRRCDGRAIRDDRSDRYLVHVMTIQDVGFFGSRMPGRSSESREYRFGFQGQETDDEIKGEGNSVAFKYRVHDPRLGRFLGTDPLEREYPFYSPYSFSGNRVIDAFELEGLEPVVRATDLNMMSGGPPVGAGGMSIPLVNAQAVEATAVTALAIALSRSFGEAYDPESWTTSRGNPDVPSWLLPPQERPTIGIPDINPGGGPRGLLTQILQTVLGGSVIVYKTDEYLKQGITEKGLEGDPQFIQMNDYAMSVSSLMIGDDLKVSVSVLTTSDMTLESLSTDFGLSVDRLMEMNPGLEADSDLPESVTVFTDVIERKEFESSALPTDQ